VVLLLDPGGDPMVSAGSRAALPLGDDELGHRNRPIASSTQKATDRLSTSRCIRSSITSRRSRSNSARSFGSRERSSACDHLTWPRLAPLSARISAPPGW
jgi:hypothetical protein